MPLVSVLIPTYNREETILRAVQSVLLQTFSDLEVIVIDDASSGKSKEQTLKLLSSIDDSRLKIVEHEENRGVSAARNTGFEHSRGEWIALLDSDDEWLPTRLEEQMKLSENFPLIHGEEIWIRNGKRVNQKKIHKKSGGRIFARALHLCLISPSATLMKRELYEEMGGFREDYPVCEDYEMWLRVTAKYDIGFIETPIINKYGGHEDQLSAKFKAMDYWRVKAMDEVLKSHGEYIQEEERRELISVVIKKCEILKMGYEKHQNLEKLPFIEDLLQGYRGLQDSLPPLPENK